MNYAVFQFINDLSGHLIWLDSIMVLVSKYGLELFAIWLGFVWVLGDDRRRHIVVQSGFAGMLALFLNYVIAQFYFESRPFVSHSVHLLFPHAADASFPSDHTSGAFALALTVLICKRWSGWWGYSMLALAVATGISRVYVGHHYPGDVIGSIVVAFLSSLLLQSRWILLAPLSTFIIKMYKKLFFRLLARKKAELPS